MRRGRYDEWIARALLQRLAAVPFWAWVVVGFTLGLTLLPIVLTGYGWWWAYWLGEPLMPRVP